MAGCLELLQQAAGGHAAGQGKKSDVEVDATSNWQLATASAMGTSGGERAAEVWQVSPADTGAEAPVQGKTQVGPRWAALRLATEKGSEAELEEGPWGWGGPWRLRGAGAGG